MLIFGYGSACLKLPLDQGRVLCFETGDINLIYERLRCDLFGEIFR